MGCSRNPAAMPPAIGATDRPTCCGWCRSGPWPPPACLWPRSGPYSTPIPTGSPNALVDVEQRLTDRINDLVARRDTLHRLAIGDRALLPDRALALLDRAADFGFTPDDVKMAWEGLVLVRALVPAGFDDYLSRIERALNDPQYMSLIKRMWCAAQWEPDDPRVDELATAMADHYLAHPSLLPIPAELQARTDSAIRYSLLTHHGQEEKPAWARLTALVEAHLRSAGIEIADQTPTD